MRAARKWPNSWSTSALAKLKIRLSADMFIGSNPGIADCETTNLKSKMKNVKLGQREV